MKASLFSGDQTTGKAAWIVVGIEMYGVLFRV